MKRIYYFYREFEIDILTTIIAIAGVFVTWQYAPIRQSERFKTSISIITAVIALLIIIYSRSRNREFLFSALTRRSDTEKWIGYGIFQLSRVRESYEITQADPGYIHSYLLTWSDYEFSFDFKIANKCLGVIVRAVNLANYIMLQISQLGIRPHVRINGGWRVWEAVDAGLTFETKLDADAWHKCVIKCDKNTITILLFSDRQQVFNRSWEIPRGNVLVEYRHSDEVALSRIPFPITLEYGSIGFRDSGDEKAYVKNVLVEKL